MGINGDISMIIRNHIQNVMARKRERARERKHRIMWKRRFSRMNEREERFQHLFNEVMLNTPVPGSFGALQMNLSKAHDDMVDSIQLALQPIFEFLKEIEPYKPEPGMNPYLKPMPKGRQWLHRMKIKRMGEQVPTTMALIAGIAGHPMAETIIKNAVDKQKQMQDRLKDEAMNMRYNKLARIEPLAVAGNNEWGEPMETIKELFSDIRTQQKAREYNHKILFQARDHGKTKMMQDLTDLKLIPPRPRKSKRKKYAVLEDYNHRKI